MNAPALVLVTALLGLSFNPAQEPQKGQQKEKKKALNPVTAFFQGEAERLDKEVEGAWMIFGYADPNLPPMEEGVTGFAMFRDGFLTWMLGIDSAERHLLWLHDFLILDSGAYRYRFDEQAYLQLSSVMSFSNDSEDGVMEHQPSGLAFEYFAKLEDGVLELRNPQGLVISLRKVTAGDFPESAIQKIEGRRGTDFKWEEDDFPRRDSTPPK